jgi:hypothetical protein
MDSIFCSGCHFQTVRFKVRIDRANQELVLTSAGKSVHARSDQRQADEFDIGAGYDGAEEK